MISTFIINLKHRTVRRENIENEFKNKNKDFNVTIIEAIEDTNGAKGLWLSMQHIINNFTTSATDYIIICEDDHKFTENYSYNSLKKSIECAIKLNAEILLGGVSWSRTVLKYKKNICWVEQFNGTQFTIIFRNMFEKIKRSKYKEGEHADIKLSNMSNNKYVISPFISIQQEFGHSDITQRNSETGMLQKLFKDCEYNINSSILREHLYRKIKNKTNLITPNVSIPTYIFNNSGEKKKIDNLINLFKKRDEFKICHIESQNDAKVNLAIKKFVTMALNNDDDVIAVVLDNFEITKSYNKNKLINNIILAHNCECDIILGNILYDFDYAIPVNNNLIWINNSSKNKIASEENLLIIFKKFFKRIIRELENIDQHSNIYQFFSEKSNNVMTMYPFISNTYAKNSTTEYRIKNIIKQYDKIKNIL